MVERRDWVADALTAHQVTALQAFRDMFSDEVLRPGDEVAIGTVTLMFTDLKGSTALYDRVGDAQAFHMVREHFAVLAKAVREHDGAIVKTIGDAVMAAFADPAQAVRAALAIQSAPAGGIGDQAGPAFRPLRRGHAQRAARLFRLHRQSGRPAGRIEPGRRYRPVRPSGLRSGRFGCDITVAFAWWNRRN